MGAQTQIMLCQEPPQKTELTHRVSPRERALAAIDDSLWEWRQGGHVWGSDDVWHVLGFASPDVRPGHDSLEPLLHPDEKPGLLIALASNLEGGTCFDEQFRLQNDAGEYLWFRAWGQPSLDPDNGQGYISGAIRNITHHRAAAAASKERSRHAMRQQRMHTIDCLASGIAHEFNNLLQAVCGYVEFARKSLPTDSQEHTDLSKALEAAGMATTLTRRLLEFSRAEGEEETTFDLRETLDSFRDLLHVVTGQGVNLCVESSESPAFTKGDETALKQALLNLVLNARDAMPNGGTVLIRSEVLEVDSGTPLALQGLRPGSYTRFLVNDTGDGIPPVILEHIFDPFYTTKAAGNGTGLGLSVAHSVAARFGGLISVDSEVGEGSSFSLYVPVESPATPPTDCLSLQVLYYCRDPLHQKAGCHTCGLAGIEAMSFGSATALAGHLAASRTHVDAIVIETEADKQELETVLKETLAVSSEIPIVVVSPLLVQSRALLESIDSDAQHLAIPGPFDASQIANAVLNAGS